MGDVRWLGTDSSTAVGGGGGGVPVTHVTTTTVTHIVQSSSSSSSAASGRHSLRRMVRRDRGQDSSDAATASIKYFGVAKY